MMNVQDFQVNGDQVARSLEAKYRIPPVEIRFTASSEADKTQIMIEVQVTAEKTRRAKRFERVLPRQNTGVNLEGFITQCIHKFLRGS
jgi:hypothetical protein